MEEIVIRPEHERDYAGIRLVNQLAFGREGEGSVVAALRENGALAISLVAARAGEVIGHVAFSPVGLRTSGDDAVHSIAYEGIGLGPVAVLPDEQGKGIGSRLIRAGLAHCRAEGWPYSVVLGHAGYYPRFGYVSSAPLGIGCEFDVPPEAFMVLALVEGALDGRKGTIYYREEFRTVT